MEVNPSQFAPIQAGDPYEEMNREYNQPEQPVLGKVTYKVKHGTGAEGEIDEHEIMNQLRNAGYMPTGVSGDGMTLTLQGAKDPYEVEIKDVLKNMGWEVQSQRPTNANTDHIDMGLRALIESPSLRHDDQMKSDIIKGRLQRSGLENPQVVGSGSDWYAFDPGNNEWYALTNKPGMDMSDLGEAAVRAPGIVGSGIGMAMGTGAGPLGMAGGSAAGGFMGNRAVDAVGSLVSDDYGKAIRDRGMDNVGDYLKDAGEDALGGFAGFGLGKMGSIGKGLLSEGLVSRGLKAGGEAARVGAGAVESAADFMSKGLARDVGGMMMDPTGLTGYTQIPQLLKDAVMASRKGIGKLGESSFFKDLAPETATKARDLAARLSKEYVPSTRSAGERFASSVTHKPFVNPEQFGAEEIGLNAGKAAGSASPWPGKIGRGIDTADRLGKMADRVLYAPYDAAVGAAKYGGKGLRKAGEIAKDLGTGLAPIETPMALNYGSEELFNRLRKRQRALQDQGYERNIFPDNQLVQYP